MPSSALAGREMEALLQLGNAAFIDEEYETAVKHYTDHLSQHEGDATALAGRSAALLKLNKYREALQDASTATKLKADYEIAFYRKGLAAFSLSEYETAKQAFERGAALLEATGKADATRKYKTWIRKCDAEIESGDEVVVAAEPAAPPVHHKVAAAPTPAPVQSKVPATLPPEIKYQYYQTATHLTVTVLQKDVKPEDATIDIQPRKLTVKVKRRSAGAGEAVDGDSSSSKEVVVLDKCLYDEVVVPECTTKFFAPKFEIKLKKVSAYQWADLAGSAEASSSSIAAPVPSQAVAPSAATSTPAIPRPYASQRNWDNVEKEIEKELEADKPEGEEALNKLFKDIYAKGSDETRRAMIKSFQTSGGTVLSTNWNEVAKKDYEKEKQAPEGMEWKTWEGKKVATTPDSDDTTTDK